MKNNIYNNNHSQLYRLYKYIICFSESEITACCHCYSPKYHIISQICHPAQIDQQQNILVIKQYQSKGNETKITLETFKILISSLPEWNLTTHFQLKNGIKHNDDNIYPCSLSSFLDFN